MKFAISTEGNRVSAHFGRAPLFTFVTIEEGDVVEKEALSNPGHTVGSIPQFVNEHGANCMIAGGMGRRAVQFFEQYGINVITGIQGTIDEVIEKIKNNTLEGGESLCAPGGGKGYGVEKIHTEADDEYKHDHNH
ncbi:MAG: NifB/NifX family molybdenum-iron cluster-binding protein [Promethearchaeati archaeon]